MRLIIKHLEEVIQDIQLEEGQDYFVGRQEDCEITLEDDTLSRKHLKIHQSPESNNWIIESISEKGGLLLEGKEIDGLELEMSETIFLKDYAFEFFVETKNEEETDKEEEKPDATALIPAQDDQEEATNTGQHTNDGSTKILPADSLIYSLHIFVEGESSDHIDLSEGDQWILGRSENCDIYIDYNILSRNHIQFTRTGNIFSATDLGSSNGSFLNEEKMIPNKAYALEANDCIVVEDLKITFEVRNKDFEDMMKNLPAVTSDQQTSPAPSAMAFPKIVLEEGSEDAAGNGSGDGSFFNKKRIILFSGVGILLLSLFLFSSKKEEKKLEKVNKQEQKQLNLVKESYGLAVQFLQQKKFQFCIDELNKLHTLVSSHMDSLQILAECKNSAKNQKKYEEFLANEKKRKKTEERISELVKKCQEQASSFQTIDDLQVCAREILELDPSNTVINAMKLQIEEKQVRLQIEQEKKENYKKMIQGKKYLYNKAYKMHQAQADPLKVIQAYKKFLRSAKGMRSLSSLYKKSEAAINQIQTNYDNELNSLYSNCTSLIESNEMKQAYSVCKNILKFKKNDKKALEYIKLATQTIRNKLKAVYEKSMLEESLANVNEAQQLWKQIIKEDIEDGYYYKKAKFLLNKYK